MAGKDPFREAVSAFGAAAKSKLSNPAVTGAPEDQIRAPLERLIQHLAVVSGLPAGAVSLVGESTLSELSSRPDYAVVVSNSLVGFIELKAPGKGADPRRFTDKHDKEQWNRLKALPNLIYTDGNAFSLWRDGEIGGVVVRMDDDIETAGAALSAPTTLLPLISDFLRWNPIPPRTPKQLAEISARLCRLLRDEVIEQLSAGNPALTELAKDWRILLFPEATDDQFADGYAQAVAFGLLVARAKDIPLADGIDHAARELRKTDSLIGTALRLLTDDTANQAALQMSLGTLTRVLGVVNWELVSKGKADAWLYFYEDFLNIYDKALRRSTGSYYTPPEVVDAMVRLVDDALRSADLFNQPLGLASPDVTVADPAVGTGTFLLGVLRRIAGTIAADQGAGAIPAAIQAASRRLIGFELQFGPFAVAQLRLLAEMHALMKSANAPELRLFVTDTLGNPYAEEERLPAIMQPIGRSRREANAVKRGEPITVVIGNPPYKEKAKGRGGWIEQGTPGRASPLDWWIPPAAWGVGAHAKHLRNLYVYFWRWATWKVFGTGLHASTGIEETDRAGVVCFITVAGFLNGPGFERMRDDLRRTCRDIWVIDCSPEGHQPEVATRIFQGVQQPVCIVLAGRTPGTGGETPARVRFRALPEGPREAKFAALSTLRLDDPDWTECPDGWRAPFLPVGSGAWGSFPALEDFFAYHGSGVMPGRTWVIAPDAQSLRKRWATLVRERDPARKELLFHPHLRNGQPGDKHIRKRVAAALTGHPHRTPAVIDDEGEANAPVRYAFRSFDRQWIIPDARVINQPNPTLWNIYSSRQIYLTTLQAHSPTAGPAITFCGAIPDLHHYKGNFGGRAFPLWADAAATQTNIRPALLAHLSAAYGMAVKAEDVMAYLAAVMAHPAFTARFASDLVRPGLRVPFTADRRLFTEAAGIGREVIWLHTFGERFADPAAGRPAGPPRLPKADAPYIPAEGAIPGDPTPLPDAISYDPATRRLHIGAGFVANVPQAVWEYEVSGMLVLRQWFSYRRLDRRRPIIGDRRPPSSLEALQPSAWLAEYTTDLIDLLNVLGLVVALETRQADLLDRILTGPLLSDGDLSGAGAFAATADALSGGERAADERQGVLL